MRTCTDARTVHGEIFGAFENRGRERALGHPVAGGGFDQRFEVAVIHRAPAAGAWTSPGGGGSAGWPGPRATPVVTPGG